MGLEDRDSGDLTVWATEDGGVSVDVGARFVAVSLDDLERILDRVAADGASIRLVGGEGRADDGDDPERDPATNTASYVLGLAHRRGIAVTREG
ncbi:MAG TPA: hypothetical protein VFL03_16975 [Candidatus Limnocylindrales bacterium]|nr:hypothetical protein [Candidatus Limnocylindrales bacterium]